MAKSKQNFSAAMKQRAATSAAPTTEPVGNTTPLPKPESKPEPEPSRAKPLQQSRVGKKTVIAYIDKAAHKQLKNLATELEKSQQEILVEALNQYFTSHNKPPIA